MIKGFFLIGLLVLSIMALTASAAFAAQGTITEVNPSGVGSAFNASDGRVADGLGRNHASLFLSLRDGGTIAP